MKFIAKPETIEKIESLKGKILFDHERGEEGRITSVIKINPYGQKLLDEGHAAIVRVEKSIKKSTGGEYVYKGEEGFQKLLREWKEKKNANS